MNGSAQSSSPVSSSILSAPQPEILAHSLIYSDIWYDLLSSRYKKSKYGNSDEKMKMYTTLMSAYGTSAGIDFHFDGTVANTLQAHRVIQHFQEEKGPEVADKLVNCMTALPAKSAFGRRCP